MADPNLAARYAKMKDFPFSDEEVPIWATYHESRDYDIGTFDVVDPTGLTMPSAAAACQLVLPILEQHAPRTERFVIGDMKELLDVTMQGGSRNIIDGLDWNFWQTTWPSLVIALEDHYADHAGYEDPYGEDDIAPSVDPSILSALLLASKACGYWLEHVAMMAQNNQGFISWAFDPDLLYPHMDPEEHRRVTNRVLYEKESLALAVVNAVMALAEYYDQIVTPYGQVEYRVRFEWPDRLVRPITSKPYLPIPLPRRDKEVIDRLQQWLRVWWYYYLSKRSMVLSAPHVLETPELPSAAPWVSEPPGVSFFLIDEDEEIDDHDL